MSRKKYISSKMSIYLLLAAVLSLTVIYLINPGIFSFSGKQKPAESLSQSEVNPSSSSLAESPASSPAEKLPPAANQEALALYQQGLELYYEHKLSEALTYFNKALALDKLCYQALNAKGATYAFLGRYDEGIALINQALALNPDFVYGHFNLGLANELAGRWDPAIAAYLEAIRLDSKDVWSYYGIASIYGRAGNAVKVIEYLEQAIALDPAVKEVAREEHDFDPVRRDPGFQKLISITAP
ncbi:MAG TPA: tetratricopeptide repeat protein [Desulfitobacteriaceae bacterium]|nr:tetratricopeptide repeat protein [Desulfitobacteriaceae bacterium]